MPPVALARRTRPCSRPTWMTRTATSCSCRPRVRRGDGTLHTGRGGELTVLRHGRHTPLCARTRRRWVELSAFDVASRDPDCGTTELGADLADDPVPTDLREQFKDAQNPGAAPAPGRVPLLARESLLVSTGSRVVEVGAASGEPTRRSLAAADRRVHCLATYLSTSLVCIGDRRELLIWGPDAVAVVSVEHRGDRCVDCSVVDGPVSAALIGSDDGARLLTAARLTVERDGLGRPAALGRVAGGRTSNPVWPSRTLSSRLTVGAYAPVAPCAHRRRVR